MQMHKAILSEVVGVSCAVMAGAAQAAIDATLIQDGSGDVVASYSGSIDLSGGADIGGGTNNGAPRKMVPTVALRYVRRDDPALRV